MDFSEASVFTPCPPVYPLHRMDCCERGVDIDLMRSVVKSDPDSLYRPQPWTPHNLLPLHHACRKLHVSCVQFLLEAGARPSAVCPYSTHNALYFAVLCNHVDNQLKMAQIVNLLLNYRQPHEQLYVFEENFMSDFSRLIELGLNNIIKLLLQEGEIINHFLPENDYPKIYNSCSGFFAKAVISKNYECLKTLILHGFEVPNYVLQNKKFFAVPYKMLKVFKDDVLDPLILFWNFGGNVSTNHKAFGLNREITNILLYLQEHPNSLQNCGLIQNEIERMMTTPLSLKALCRLHLWRNLGKDYWWKIYKFCLPKELYKYLSLQEL